MATNRSSPDVVLEVRYRGFVFRLGKAAARVFAIFVMAVLALAGKLPGGELLLEALKGFK